MNYFLVYRTRRGHLDFQQTRERAQCLHSLYPDSKNAVFCTPKDALLKQEGATEVSYYNAIEISSKPDENGFVEYFETWCPLEE